MPSGKAGKIALAQPVCPGNAMHEKFSNDDGDDADCLHDGASRI